MDFNPLFTKDRYTLEEVFKIYKKLEVNCHYTHVASKTFAQHEAWGKLYNRLHDLSDRFVEAALGFDKSELRMPISISIDIFTIDDAVNGLKEVEEIFDELCQDCNVASVENILAETLEAIQTTLYLLTLK